MTYLEHIQESAAKFGWDEQEARDLYKHLATCNEPGAAFAAVCVLDIIRLTSEAHQKMTLLASLADEGVTVDKQAS